MIRKTIPSGRGYLEHLPSTYDSNTDKKYPMIIWLHGQGERGNGSEASLNLLKKASGLPKKIQNGWDAKIDEHEFIVLAPQMSTSTTTWTTSVLRPFLDHVMKTYRYEPSMVYVIGWSMGGNGVYKILSNTYTDYFAAGVVISGYDNSCHAQIVSRKIPVSGHHGNLDKTIKYTTGFTQFNRFKVDVGYSYVNYPWYQYIGGWHDITAQALDHTSSENIYKWLLSHKKQIQ